MRVLTLNAGSTSLKAHLVDGGVVVAAGTADWRGDNRAEVLRATLEELGVAGRESGPAGAGGFPDRAPGVDVVAHRIVHGGDAFTEHVVIDDEVEAGIAAVGSL
ncbi:MAG TPA: hypothetical protein VFP22_06435, partial [Candidatus Limnocylindrales bacterium]|nr:hypothetical protein [Candidatus Limnocylindrales bacterium]